MGRPLGEKIPCGVRQRGKSDKKECCQWQDPPPGDTKSLSTFPSGIFALGCGPPGPLWRSDRSGNRSPSHLIPSNNSSLGNHARGRNRLLPIYR
jgi:hypothetical protein